MSVDFTEENIQALFGHEAAENEDPERLREYYFKGRAFDQVVNSLPIRILVGHKGIGKSALFKIAIAEDKANDRLPVLIKPDDIAQLTINGSDFLQLIRGWKDGLLQIIASKALAYLNPDDTSFGGKAKYIGGGVFDFLRKTFANSHTLNLGAAEGAIVRRFGEKKELNVYIDDLDRGWQGRKEDVTRISALLNATRDLVSENEGLKFRISLRSDVYYLVRTSDESTDKIEGSVIWYSWSNHEIFALLVKRIETFFGRTPSEQELLRTPQRDLAHFLNPIMVERFQGHGKWENTPIYRILMSVIRKRPRDLVKLLTLAARAAHEDGQDKIYTGHFDQIFEEYSQGRIQDTINEFRSELPDIERLITNMKRNRKEKDTKSGYIYSTDALIKKIDNIRQGGEFRFHTGRAATTKELAAFMYKINFLTARKETENGIERRYFEENRYLSSQFADFGFDWEIHPAYRWALQPETIDEIYQQIALGD